MNHLCIKSFMTIPVRKGSTMILAFCWCSGLIAGCYYVQCAGEIQFAMMRRAVSSPVSIVGLAVVLLPFLLSALAVYLSQTWLFLPVSFLKAFSFAYSAGIATLSFGNAGWLVRCLLFFTDLFTIPLLLWIWFRWIDGGSKRAFRETVACSVICIIAGSIDYFVVSPFLGMLI